MAELPRYMKPFWKLDKSDEKGLTYKLDAEGLRRRMELCAEACEGLTDDALKKGIVETGVDALDRVYWLMRYRFEKADRKDVTFEGVKVWED